MAGADRSCRISAALERGLDVIDGTVIVLGRKGARFQPVNVGAYARIKDVMGHPGMFLVVDGRRLLLHSAAAKAGYVSLFFLKPLLRSELTELLTASSITPRIAPKEPKRKHSVARRAKALPTSVRSEQLISVKK